MDTAFIHPMYQQFIRRVVFVATIYKRPNSKLYCVIYYYKTPSGQRKQKWESGYTYKQAKARKVQIENDMFSFKFISPHHVKVKELFEQFIKLYGQKNWQPKTFESNLMLIEKHIIPYIGEFTIQAITPIIIESLFCDLMVANCTGYDNRTLSTRRNIYIILKQCFSLAVEWKLLNESPVQMKPPIVRKSEALF